MSVRRFFLDISPLIESRAFRFAYFARAATVLVTGMLMVAASVQLYELTKSSVAVAFLNVSMATPMVLALIAGGVLSDRMDRRSLMVWSRSATSHCPPPCESRMSRLAPMITAPDCLTRTSSPTTARY